MLADEIETVDHEPDVWWEIEEGHYMVCGLWAEGLFGLSIGIGLSIKSPMVEISRA